MLQNAYLLAKIGANTAENERQFANASNSHAPAMEAALEHALSEQMAEDANFWQRQQQLLRPRPMFIPK